MPRPCFGSKMCCGRETLNYHIKCDNQNLIKKEEGRIYDACPIEMNNNDRSVGFDGLYYQTCVTQKVKLSTHLTAQRNHPRLKSQNPFLFAEQ